MQIDPVFTVVLTGLVAVYLWRENKILARRLSEASIQESNRRYKEIFDNGSDGVFVVEVMRRGKFRFESLNPAAVQAISPHETSLGGRRFDENAKNGNDAELARILSELAGHLRRCLGSGLPAEYESVFRVSPDGSRKSYHIKLIPMADDGGISHILCFLQDITTRKLYEQELLERIKLEERLSGFAATAPGFLYTYRHGTDGSNAMPFASAGIADIFGLGPADVARSIGQMNLRIHPDDMSGVIDATAASAANLTPISMEFRVRHPEKGELWVESRSTPVPGMDGSIEWHGFMHDITGRKLSEQRLLQAHEFTEGIVNAISDPIFVKDRQHRWLLLNDACCALIGHAREELIGKSDYEFFPKKQADEFWAGDERVFASGLVDINEESITSSDGTTRYIHTKKTPYTLNGSSYLIAVIRDITERRKMEDELRRKRESLDEAQRIGQMGSWELDLASGVLTWSDEIYRIFEVDPAQFGASYDAFLNAIHPDDREAVNKAYTESLENRLPYSIEHRLLFADGRIKHVRECCETRYAENGELLYSHGTVQDITALKETERRLSETQDKLRELVISRESHVEGVRKRIAWEMHEELGQLLAATKMRMYGLRGKLPRDVPSLHEDSIAIVGLVDKSIKTVHDIVSDLRPTVLLHGTVAALEWLAAEFGKRTGIDCELEVEEDGTLASDELTTLVFRIAQESLENLARHPGLSRAAVSWISKQKGFCLTVWYDGDSFVPAGEKSLSFFGMQERVAASGGEMQVFSSPEGGTAIEARFPARKALNQYPLFAEESSLAQPSCEESAV
jgi:PAS domain S-box-containing protein